MQGKIEILVIPSWFPPEGGGFFKDHAESMVSDDLNVSVLVTRIVGVRSHGIKKILQARKITEKVENSVFIRSQSMVKCPGMEKYNTLRYIEKSIANFTGYLEKRPRPDIIIAHSAMWAGVVAEKLSRVYNIPYIIVEHRGRFLAENRYASSFIKDWHKELLEPVFRNASHIVCVSDALKQGISQYSLNGQISVIPNLVNTDFFVLPEYSREKEPFVFLSAGMLEKVKDYETLLKAFALFTWKVDGEFFLRIAGKGGELKALKALSRELGIKGQVTFTGHLSRERLRDEMQRSNVFVSSSIIESFGVAIVEAASTGLPVIATRSGGPESYINEINGVLCEPRDPASLEKMMELMYFNYSEFDGQNIRNDVLNRYSRNSVSQKYNGLIKNILNAAQSISK